MKAPETIATIVDGYIGLLDNLSTTDKLEIISRLTNSVKSDLPNKKSTFKMAFGAFESSKTAEEMIDEIRESRISARKIESF